MACANDTFSTFSNFLGAFAMFVVVSNNFTIVVFHAFSLKIHCTVWLVHNGGARKTLRTHIALPVHWCLVVEFRVGNVVADHNDLLTQWRPIWMSKFCANIFLIRTTSNYLWASEVSKNQVFKSQFFSSSHASNQWIMKIW